MTKNFNWIKIKDIEPVSNIEYRVFGRCFLNNKWMAWGQQDAIYLGNGWWEHGWYSDKVEITHYMDLPDSPTE